MIYVIPLYGVSRGLNLNLSSVGGRSLKLTDYYQAEARRYRRDRAKTEAETMRQSRGRGSKVETEARPCEAEARPTQLKNCLEAASSRGRCLEDYIPAKFRIIKPTITFRDPGVGTICSVGFSNTEAPAFTFSSSLSAAVTDLFPWPRLDRVEFEEESFGLLAPDFYRSDALAVTQPAVSKH